MLVSDLINLLKNMPPDLDVVVFDYEWSEYNDVTGVLFQNVVIAVHKDDSNSVYLLPDDNYFGFGRRRIGEKVVVQLTVA